MCVQNEFCKLFKNDFFFFPVWQYYEKELNIFEINLRMKLTMLCWKMRSYFSISVLYLKNTFDFELHLILNYSKESIRSISSYPFNNEFNVLNLVRFIGFC